MHEHNEEGMHDRIEVLYALIFDEYFRNLEQIRNIKTGPSSAISRAFYLSFECNAHTSLRQLPVRARNRPHLRSEGDEGVR